MNTTGWTHFAVLGPLLVTRDGVPLDVGGPKPRALLLSLLLRRGEPVSADLLVEQVWGDQRPNNVSASLHATVSNLRRILADGGGRALSRTAAGYRLDLPAASVDAELFELHLAAGRRATAEGEPARAREELEAGLSLWRGRAFADVEDHPFAAAEITRLGELRQLAREERAAAMLALGDPASAVVELEALVTEHPLRERLRGLLVLGLYRDGRQAEALATCRQAREHLADELGIDPGPELVRLESQVLRQDPALDWVPPSPGALTATGPPADGSSQLTAAARSRTAQDPGVLSAAPAALGSAAPGLAALGPTTPQAATQVCWQEARRPVMVGRDAQMAVLRGAWHDALSGRGRTVTVVGEAGIGKSRLAEALAEEVIAGGGRVHWGRCFETAGAPVYWPWSQVLRGVLTPLGAEDPPVLRPSTAADLSLVLPELLGERSRSGAPAGGSVEDDKSPAGPSAAARAHDTDPLSARFRLLDAIGRVLLAAAGEHPLLVILEDLHWADEASLDALRHLAPSIAAGRVLIVGTHRPVTVGAQRDALAHLAARSPAMRLDVPPLDVAGMRALVERSAPIPSAVSGDCLGLALGDGAEDLAGDATGRLAEQLAERSDGNALYAVQLLGLIGADGRLPDGIPGGLRELLLSSLGDLASDARDMLEVGAVVGREFSPTLLAEVLGTTPAEVMGRLDPASEAGLVSLPQGGDTYRFAHVLLRDAVYDALPPSQRAQLHASIGEALENDGSRVAEAAHHLTQARALGYAGRAVDARVRAADRAGRLFAFADAESHLRAALPLAAADPAREAVVHARLAALLILTQGYTAPAVRASADRVARLTGERKDAELATWAHWVHACVRADHADAMRIAERAVDEAEADGSRAARAAAHQMHGTTLWHLGRARDAAAAFDRSLAHLDEIDDRLLTGPRLSHVVQTTLGHSALNLYSLDECEEAARRLRRGLQLAVQVGPFSEAFIRQIMAYVGALQGDTGLGEEARHSRALILRYDFRHLAILSEGVSGWHLAVGDRDPAGIDRIAGGLKQMDGAHLHMMLPAFGRLLGDALERHGRAGEADAAYAAALRSAEETGEHMFTAELLWRRSLLAAPGEVDALRRLAHERATVDGVCAVLAMTAEPEVRVSS